jgi:purine nucleosidase
MTRRPIIIDCDPGVDDAIALMLALGSPELDIRAIVTVAGNVPLALTQHNARQICELMGRRDIPIYAGCPRPLVRSLVTAEAVHGTTGLNGITLPEPTLPLQQQHGVSYLIETLQNAPAPMTLATLGPLTNIAAAIIQCPSILDSVAEIVMMGGAVTRGNITPVAEFNLYVDPHGARVVFEAAVPITMLSLDVTHQVLTTPDRLAQLRAIGTPISQVAVDLLTPYGASDRQQFGLTGAPLHDPCVIAYLLKPELFTTYGAEVRVETDSALTLGQTIVNPRPAAALTHPVQVADTVDAVGIYQRLQDCLAVTGRPHSPR